ncbi:MAG: serine/threonine-protein phosphatase [Nostocales cyanobacterium]|nr:MAG: serine/threonine-protein phosphatase [Nostocales cyanobacterium]
MNTMENHNPDHLIIQTNTTITLENHQIEIIEYLGQLTIDVYYFQVQISTSENPDTKLGLLRVGEINSGLNREIQLREKLGDYKLIAPLILQTQLETVTINLNSSENESLSNLSNIKKKEDPENDEESEFLEEEYYEEQEISPNSSPEKIILLSYIPEQTNTLKTWLIADHNLEKSIFLSSQVCQFFRYLHQQNWCMISILPEMIAMTTPVQFFDLTTAYPLDENLPAGLLGNYYAPELAYNNTSINELMSSYTVAALLYHKIHQKPIEIEQLIEPKIKPIPRIFQLLKICLSPIPEERFPLSQLLSNLVETRQILNKPKINWNIAHNSTVGLSLKRLQNEDNYGFKQQQISNTETLLLGVVADGMGGMSKGELASKIAVETVLKSLIPAELQTLEQRNQWLIDIFQKANENVNNTVTEGGTTLSVILAFSQQLMMGHVGDSRIYLLRKREIKQLSEDHSYVGLLVASGEITLEESLTHPDRNVLTKYIGAKTRLSDGYVQTLESTSQQLTINLENNDILLLCSDGVWDLISTHELTEIFTTNQDLQFNVNHTINQVIERGASDNATLLAFQFTI